MLLPRVLATWCALAALMTANGVAIILAVTRAAFRPLAARPARTRAAYSALLVGLTVGFELVVGRWVDHRTWAELAGNYALWRGRLWPLVLLALASTPFLWMVRGSGAGGRPAAGATAR
jgi:hypothetical protein